MVHFDTIWNDILELQTDKYCVFTLPNLTRLKTRCVNRAFWRYLKLYFGTADRQLYCVFTLPNLTRLKTRSVNRAFWRYLKLYFGTADRQLYCVFTLPNLTRLKSRIVNGAFWRYLKRYFRTADIQKEYTCAWFELCQALKLLKTSTI